MPVPQFHFQWRLALAAVIVPFALGLALLPVSARRAAAQEPVRLVSLQVSLWPEYDRPATLVILDGQLDPSVTLPASLAVRMPARAGTPHAVATVGTASELLTAAFTTQPAGDDIIVMFQAQSLGFRVEYYDPALTVNNETRQFDFDWQTDYAIAEALVRVQQPAGARDLAGEPALTSLGEGADGLIYHEASWGPTQPGERLSLRLSYAKTGTALTTETLGLAPAPQAVAPSAQADNRLPWIVGGSALGLAAVAAGVYFYARSRRPAPARAAHRSRRRARPSQQPRPAVASAPARFCTQCGQPLVAGDRFCRNCGAAVASS